MEPARITALAPDPRRPGAVRVALDGVPWGTVARSAVDGLALEVGCTLADEALEALHAAADTEAALRAGLRHLERRAFATTDLRRRLERRGHRPGSAAAAVERLAGMGLLDDAAFARQFVESRSARGRGPQRLRLDLRALGVADAHVEAALAARWPAGADTLADARRLAGRRRAQLGALPRPVLRRRLLAYLARRGYVGAEASRAVAEALQAAEVG